MNTSCHIIKGSIHACAGDLQHSISDGVRSLLDHWCDTYPGNDMSYMVVRYGHVQDQPYYISVMWMAQMVTTLTIDKFYYTV